MLILSGIWAELREDKTAEILVAAAALLAITRALAILHRERLRSALILLGLHVVLVPIAGAFRVSGSSLYRETRLAALVLATLAFIGLLATVPRIVQDVLVAGSSVVAVFMLASHAGLNLSGLIATSAVLTAIIGLAFQDTLGNVVGGLAIQIDDSVRLGDWIKVRDVVGRVTEIRWRYTAIETRSWETIILPNSMLVKEQVMVLGRRQGQPAFLRRSISFNVDFRYPPSDVVSVTEQALRGAPIESVAEIPPPECVLMSLDESYARYTVRYWLTNIATDGFSSPRTRASASRRSPRPRSSEGSARSVR